MADIIEHNGLRLQHEKWEASGRTFAVVDADDQPTGQKCYRSQIGERNTDDGAGGFLPFLWKSASHRLQFGRDGFELEAETEDMRIVKGASVLARSFTFVVQAWIGGKWVTMPKGTATRQIRPDEVFRDGEFVTDDRRCTVFWSWSPALYDLRVGIEAGGGEGASMGLRFRPAQNARVRFLIVLDGLEKLPADWEWLDRTIAEETRHVGIRVRDFQWRWTWDEAPYRSIIKEDNADGTMKVAVVLGAYDTVADEWLTVYPDSWGPEEPQADADTGVEDWGDLHTDWTIYVGDYDGSNFEIACYRWSDGVDVPADATISSCTLGVTAGAVHQTTVVMQPFFDVGANREAAWDSSSRPSSGFTKSTGGATKTVAAAGDWVEDTEYTFSLTTEMQELVDLAGWSTGDVVRLGVWPVEASTTNGSHVSCQGDTWDEMPTLTVVYSTGGGGLEAVVGDAVTLTEEVSAQVSVLEAVAEDAVTVSDEVTVNLGGYVEAVAEDAVTVSDEVTVNLGGYVEAVAEDAVTVTDEVTASLGGYVEAVVGDAVTLIDEVVAVEVGYVEAVVEDAVTLTDEVTASLGGYVEAVAEDAVTVSDEVTAVEVGYVEAVAEDAVTVSDTASSILPTLEISVTDSVTVSNPIDIFTVGSGQVFVIDAITLIDIVSVEMPVLESVIIDVITLTDEVTVNLGGYVEAVAEDAVTLSDEVTVNLGGYVEAVAEDAVTVSDEVVSQLSSYEIEVTEDVDISESVVSQALSGLVVTSNESITLTDTVIAELTSYDIIVSDNLTLSDTPTAEIPTYEIEIDDTVDIVDIAIAEQITALSPSVYDSLSVTDEVNININPLQIETSDSLSLGDIVIASVSGVDIIATYFFTLKKHH